MNILPQNIINVLKNKIKAITENISNELVECLINSFTSLKVPNKYFDMISKIQETEQKLIIDTMINTLEEIDKSYKNSPSRKNSYYVSKSNVPRTITTIFGDLTFKRTYYQSRLDSSYHFLLDEELKLQKYDRYDFTVKSLAIDNAFNTNQKKAGEIIGKQLTSLCNVIDEKKIKTISRQSIYNWINDWFVPNFDYPKGNDVDTLYIMVDEKYLGCQNLDKDIMVKAFVAFEGVKQVSKNRRSLINRFVYTTSEKNAWEKFVDVLYHIYDSTKIKTIYVMSDCGIWIKAGIPELKVEPDQVIKRLSCEFHFKQAINRATIDKDYREILATVFKECPKEEFIKYFNELLLLTPNKKEAIEKNEKYIINNYTSIKAMINFEIGSSMESHISHLVAAPFASRPKGYSKDTIEKYLKINDYKNNNISLIQLYLNSYLNSDEISISNTNLDWSIFETNKSNDKAPEYKEFISQLKNSNAII